MGGYLSLLVPAGGSREKFISLSASSQHCRQHFDLRHSDKTRTDSSPLLSHPPPCTSPHRSPSSSSLSYISHSVPLSFPASHSGISSIIDLAIVHQPHTLTSHYTRIFISQDSRLIHTTQTQNDLIVSSSCSLSSYGMAWHGFIHDFLYSIRAPFITPHSLQNTATLISYALYFFSCR